MRRPAMTAAQRQYSRERRALLALRRAAIRYSGLGPEDERELVLVDLERACDAYANVIPVRERRKLLGPRHEAQCSSNESSSNDSYLGGPPSSAPASSSMSPRRRMIRGMITDVAARFSAPASSSNDSYLGGPPAPASSSSSPGGGGPQAAPAPAPVARQRKRKKDRRPLSRRRPR